MSIGSAIFTIEANTTAFVQGLMTAEQQARRTTQAITEGFAGLQVLPRQLAAINQTIMSTNNLLAQMAQRMQAVGRGGGGGGGGGFGAGTSGLMSISYALDDLQYGFSAILNNIPQIVMGLTGSSGIAGAASIAATAVYQLAKHWDDLAGKATPLPRMQEGLEGLARTLTRVNQQMQPLLKAQDEIVEGTRGTFDQITDIWGFGEGSLKNRQRLEQLQRLEETTKGRLADEKLLEGAGPGHTKAAEDTARRVRDVVKGLGEGAETLSGLLSARGMGPREADQAVAGAMRGNKGFLADILERLTPEEKRVGGKFRGLQRAMEGEDLEAKRKMDAAWKAEGEETARNAKQAEEERIRNIRKARAAWDAEDAERRRNAVKAAKEAEQAAEERKRKVIESLQPRHQPRAEVRAQSAGIFEHAMGLQQAFFEGREDVAKQQLDATNKMLVLMQKLVKQGLMEPEQATREAQKLWGAQPPED